MSPSDNGFFDKAKKLTPLRSGHPSTAMGANPGTRVDAVAQMSNTEKLRRTIEYALSSPNLSTEFKRALSELLSPENLALAAAVMLVWASSHFFGVGEVVDAILIGTAYVTLGLQGMRGLADLVELGYDVIKAESDFDLRRASEKLVRASAALEAEVVLALLTRKAQIKLSGAKGSPASRGPGPKSSAPPRAPEPPPVRKPWADYEYSDLGKIAPCFPPGTLVRTGDGCRPIEELVAGDEVLAYDEEKGMVVLRPITAVWKNHTQHIVTLRVGSESIMATRLHDFWVEDKASWMPAWRLWAGMLLRSPDGRSLAVQSVEVSATQSASFNLEVEHAHTFFVGKQGILVHNGKGRPSAFESLDKKPTAIYGVYDKKLKKFTYIGQTTQMDNLGNVSVETRFQQHLNRKPQWKEAMKKGRLRVRMLMSGEVTAYEAAVWELHHIKRFQEGGHPLENSASNPPIGKRKFKNFQSMHTPCS